MSQAGSYLFILGSLGIVLTALRGLRGDWPSTIVILMIWMRFAVAALGETATETSVAGFSLIALTTLFVTAVGLLAVPLDLYRSRKAFPFYVLVGCGFLSGALNGRGIELITYVIIWSFFLVCFLLLYRAYLIHGQRRILVCLLAAFSLPLGMQFLSIVLKAPKIGMDGSLSYIGAYIHEAVYAVVLLCALWLVTVFPWRRNGLGWAVVGCVLVGLYMANYRTIAIAALPILLALIPRYLVTDRRHLPVAMVLLVVAVLFLPQLLSSSVGERYQEIGKATSEIGNLAKPPEEFTASDKDILSARMFIWSSYLYGSLSSELPQLLFGHGPDSRPPGMKVHAHNEYLRILFETGLVGFAIWVWILARQFATACRVTSTSSRLAIVAGLLAILLGALGTSFFNRPEGMIFFAVLCATNQFYANQRNQNRRTSIARSGLPRRWQG